MSRVGQKPIAIPGQVTVTVQGPLVTVKGPKGEETLTLPEGISAMVADGTVTVSRSSDSREQKSLHGLARSLVANCVEGVSEGFSKVLEIEGVGFRGAVQGQKLSLSIGFSSNVEYNIPEGVTITVDGDTKLTIAGTNKAKVGTCAAEIRAFYPAEPYKGKGIRYKDEVVRRKVGKTVA